MIITMAQVLILLAIGVGLVGFAFMQYFTYRGLRRDAKHAAYQRKNPRLVDVHQTAQGRVIDRLTNQEEEVAPAESGTSRNQALFYLHQEQMRRFMDAKLEILRATVDTQNKISLLKAEIARLKAERDFKQAEGGHAGEQTRYALAQPADGSSPTGNVTGNGSDNLSRLIERHEETLDALIASQQEIKQEAEEKLQALESELKALPGSSPEAWAEEQLGRHDG